MSDPAPSAVRVPGPRVDARDLRKRHNGLGGSRGATWWAPGAVGWWIGVLFAVGSACFAAGSVPAYADAVGTHADGVTFFVGSIFFTTAAFLQWLESASTDMHARGARRIRVLFWEPGRIDWWASSIQLVGTLFFNRSTFAALTPGLSATAANVTVWRPDALGSICFLVSSAFAYAEVMRRPGGLRRGDLASWVVALNLLGSIAFGVSAVASKMVPATGAPRSLAWTNLGTFVGAVCFLVGGLLLLPERTREPSASGG